MLLTELRQLLADIEGAIEPYVEDGEMDTVRAAARAAVQVLMDAGVVDVDGEV